MARNPYNSSTHHYAETSRDAKGRVRSAVSKQHNDIFNLLADCHAIDINAHGTVRGRNYEQIAKALGMRTPTVTARLGELVSANRLRILAKRGTTTSGSSCRLYDIAGET